jgi:hypothetical protein
MKNTYYGLLFISIGLLVLILGLMWKKPTYGGGVVQKYTSIVVGTMSVLYGIASLF